VRKSTDFVLTSVFVCLCVLSLGAMFVPDPFAMTDIDTTPDEPIMLGNYFCAGSHPSGGTSPYNATWIRYCGEMDEEADFDWDSFAETFCANAVGKTYKITGSDSASATINKTKVITILEPNDIDIEGEENASTGTTPMRCTHNFLFRHKTTEMGVDTFTNVGSCYNNGVSERIMFRNLSTGAWEDWGDWQSYSYSSSTHPNFYWVAPRIIDHKDYGAGPAWDTWAVGFVIFEYKQQVKLKKGKCGDDGDWSFNTYHFKIKKHSATQVIHEIQ
jgi:hypothetical protein